MMSNNNEPTKTNSLLGTGFTFLFILIFGATAGFAQTTEFSYQGFITDNNAPANGNYDLEFRLFDAATGGTLIGTQQRPNVAVTNGVLSVVLDFGAFPPNNRFLEIGVRPPGGSALTTLAPRSKLLSTPYSTQARNAENAQNAVNAQNAQNTTNAQNAQVAQNALQLGGRPSNQYVLGNDPRLSDPRTPLPGSISYVQNSVNQQASSNFNITGNGIAGGTLTGNIVNATTQFNIGGLPVLRSLSFNVFVGLQAGFNNTTGDKNSFFGTGAAAFNTTGSNNSAFGVDAGRFNLTGTDNAFFGNDAGRSNNSGANNSFFGKDAGRLNTTGDNNAFFGFEAGESNASGFNNSFFGSKAGKLNTGEFNTFIGDGAGEQSTNTSNNTFVGAAAGGGNTTGVENSFFGTAAGFNNTTGSFNTIIGPFADVGESNLTNAAAIGSVALVTRSNSIVLGSINGVNGASNDTNVGIGTTAPSDRLHVNGIIRVVTLGAAGSTSLCHNVNRQISTCSSSLRYKTDITPFRSSLNLVNHLQPISFTWIDGGMRDLGLGAEDVEKVEPLLVTYSDKGEVEGVKYDRIAVVLLNAVREQQTQIEAQDQKISALQAIIDRQQVSIASLEQDLRLLKSNKKRSKK